MTAIEFKTPTGQRLKLVPHPSMVVVEAQAGPGPATSVWIYTHAGSHLVAGSIEVVTAALGLDRDEPKLPFGLATFALGAGDPNNGRPPRIQILDEVDPWPPVTDEYASARLELLRLQIEEKRIAVERMRGCSPGGYR